MVSAHILVICNGPCISFPPVAYLVHAGRWGGGGWSANEYPTMWLHCLPDLVASGYSILSLLVCINVLRLSEVKLVLHNFKIGYTVLYRSPDYSWQLDNHFFPTWQIFVVVLVSWLTVFCSFSPPSHIFPAQKWQNIHGLITCYLTSVRNIKGAVSLLLMIVRRQVSHKWY